MSAILFFFNEADPAVVGSGDGAAPALTGSATAFVGASATVGGEIPALAASASALVGVTASAAGTLAAVTGAAASVLGVSGIGAGVIAALTGAGNLQSGAASSGAGVFPALVGAALAEYYAAAPPSVPANDGPWTLLTGEYQLPRRRHKLERLPGSPPKLSHGSSPRRSSICVKRAQICVPIAQMPRSSSAKPWPASSRRRSLHVERARRSTRSSPSRCSWLPD